MADLSQVVTSRIALASVGFGAFGVVGLVMALVVGRPTAAVGAVPFLVLSGVSYRIYRLRRTRADRPDPRRVDLQIMIWGLSGLGSVALFAVVATLVS